MDELCRCHDRGFVLELTLGSSGSLDITPLSCHIPTAASCGDRRGIRTAPSFARREPAVAVAGGTEAYYPAIVSAKLGYVLFTSGCLGALAGGATAWLLARPGEENSSSDRAKAETGETATRVSAAQSPAPPGDVAVRVQELERRVAAIQALQDRLVMRQRAEAMGRASSSTDVVPTGSGSVDVADPVFEAAVADIIDRDMERRRAERQEQREQRRLQEIQQSTRRLSEKLGLSSQQESELTHLLTEHWQKLTEVRDDSNPDSSREERRKKSDAVIRNTEAALVGTLGPQNAAVYQALPAKEKLKLGGRSDPDERPGADNTAAK
jgi:hypothetical protein